jgi:hypothetical protein
MVHSVAGFENIFLLCILGMIFKALFEYIEFL